MPSPPKLVADAVRAWATRAVAGHATDLTAALARQFGVSRVAAAGAVRQLEAEAFVQRQRGGTRPRFVAGASRLVEATLALPGLDESLVWSEQMRPGLGDLAPALDNLLHYGFTELVNNANDHAGGRQLRLRCAATPEAVHLWIADDGVGVFEKVRAALGLPDVRLALLELSKGKLTTDPAHHSGEGLFFTSRAMSVFELRANGLAWRRQRLDGESHSLERLDDDHSGAGKSTGTSAFLSLRRDATHSLRQVFDAYTTGAPDDLAFDRTVVPAKLAVLAGENLLSRSQARRLVSRLAGFRVVDIDFDGIAEIGQAFADELFRVFPSEQPQIELRMVNAAPAVAAMRRRIVV